MAWKKEKVRHKLAAKGIKTKKPKISEAERKEVAQTIVQQLQAQNRMFRYEYPVKMFIILENGLRLHLGGRRYNNIDILYNRATDLYTIQFHKLNKQTFDTTTETVDGVYNDMLDEVIKGRLNPVKYATEPPMVRKEFERGYIEVKRDPYSRHTSYDLWVKPKGTERSYELGAFMKGFERERTKGVFILNIPTAQRFGLTDRPHGIDSPMGFRTILTELKEFLLTKLNIVIHSSGYIDTMGDFQEV